MAFGSNRWFKVGEGFDVAAHGKGSCKNHSVERAKVRAGRLSGGTGLTDSANSNFLTFQVNTQNSKGLTCAPGAAIVTGLFSAV
jgi:hypothetical protein